LSHSDDPGCVSPALRQLKIRLNDANWSSTMARADGLKRLALAQLGSKDVLNDPAFIRRVIDVTIRRVVPISLRAAARVHPDYATALEACAVQCEQEGTQASCNKARLVVASVFRSTTYAAADAASYAADAASYAANAASYAAYAAAADDTYRLGIVSDRVLADYAEWIVEILIDMDAPGVQWLDLAPKASVVQS
jgi:hypothetical protein